MGRITWGEAFSHSSSVIAAVPDAECHYLILSFSDVLDIMSEGIDRRKVSRNMCSTSNLGADTIFGICTLTLIVSG